MVPHLFTEKQIEHKKKCQRQNKRERSRRNDMPKVKTHSGAKKRFKKLKSGLIKAARPFKRHLLTKKTAKRKRHMRTGLYLGSGDRGHIAPLLPY